MTQFNELCDLVKQWATDKGIFESSSPIRQLEKTVEEVLELRIGIAEDNKEEVKDAIGDIIVTLIIQAEMWGLDTTDCLQSAYDVIKNRTGKMVGGIFVKDK